MNTCFKKVKPIMSSKIQLLSEQTINQIAAGEVIENPSSVVKELVENAIDAGASHVAIEILSGGFQKIKVTDDGSGMSAEDAFLCLKRHATSKIADAKDLFNLVTMGFRGEALASIAAVSKLSLLSALENAPANLIEAEGGIVLRTGPGARSRGTTIEVRSLFYNVPARKKFQKSAAASSAEITKIITQLALAHPEIGFELIQQNRSQFSLPPGHGEPFLDLLKRRAAALLGTEFLNASHKVSKKEEYPMTGLTASPALTRHNRSGQYLFVNRRPVICPALSYAVRDGYGTRIGADRHPVYLLHISIPPELVDVNVHPQKREIRLREESVVKYAVHSAITQALGDVESTYSFSSDFAPFSFSEGPDFSEPLTFREEEPEALPQEMALETELRIIGLYRDYLFVEAESFPRRFSFGPGIIWVDLPAAQSRLQFDALMRSSESPMSQGLLIPAAFSCSRAEAQLLQTHVESLHKLGIQVREIGQTVFLVESIPPFLEEEEVSAVLEELIAEMQVNEDMHRRLASCLCRRARRRKKNYHLAEAVYLVKQLLQSDDPLHCPQGKRTMVFVEEREIENQFSGAIEAFAKRNEASKAQLLSDRTAP
jgi:DNA mismatch repair protein MutL